MKTQLYVIAIFLFGAPILSQPPGAQVYSNDIGFSYSLPSDWEVKDMAPALPVVQQQAQKSATSEGEKKGAACAQIPLLATQGIPKSVIEVVTVSFSCFGQQLTDKDLAGFAAGVSGGIKKSFSAVDPVYSAFTLGTHSVWIERAKGSLKDHPENKYTVETVCSILKKGAVCWLVMSTSEDALQVFENGAVALDGDSSSPLVPANVFNKKSSQ